MESVEILLLGSGCLYSPFTKSSFFQARNNSRVCIFFFWYLSLIQIKDDELMLTVFEFLCDCLDMAVCQILLLNK